MTHNLRGCGRRGMVLTANILKVLPMRKCQRRAKVRLAAAS